MPADDVPILFDTLWEEVKPLYELLHCHVRSKLRNFYKFEDDNGMIPAHILGNM